jgi:hypothetical protein
MHQTMNAEIDPDQHNYATGKITGLAEKFAKAA